MPALPGRRRQRRVGRDVFPAQPQQQMEAGVQPRQGRRRAEGVLQRGG